MSRLNKIFLFSFLLLGIVGLTRIRLDVDIINLLPKDNAVAEGIGLYQHYFLQSGELIVTIKSPQRETTEKAAKLLLDDFNSATNLIRELFWQPPAMESIEESAKMLAYLWLNSPTSAVTSLAQDLAANQIQQTVRATRDSLATSFNPMDLALLPRDPLRLSRVVSQEQSTVFTPERFFGSEDGRLKIFYIYPTSRLETYEDCKAWLAKFRHLYQEALQRSGLAGQVQVGMTGRPAFVTEIASGMERDMVTAAPGTLFMIGLLFFLVHREIRALVFLLVSLVLIMAWTLAVGGAFFGNLNVISIGFAAILAGLAEDFGIVLHQDSKTHPTLDAKGIRHISGAAIWWSAITTSAAFGLLNLSSLPGLRQLGSLVAVGILLGAWTMLYFFLPLIHKSKKHLSKENSHAQVTAPPFVLMRGKAWSFALLFVALLITTIDPPTFSSSSDVLRPRKSPAGEALKEIQAAMQTSGDPYWLIVRGKTVEEVYSSLKTLESNLSTNPSLTQVTLPTLFWPDSQSQALNRPILKSLAKTDLHKILEAEGFESDAENLAKAVFDVWQKSSDTAVEWPQGRVANWVMPKFISKSESNYFALCLLTPSANFKAENVIPKELSSNVLLSGWGLLGKSVLQQVKRETPTICLAVVAVVALALWFTFRKIVPVLLCFCVLLFSGLILTALMRLLNWEWNLVNLTAIPLLLGMGIDYSIHILTAIERNPENPLQSAWHVGRALLLAGATSIIGFLFLGFSSNRGMAALGSVCALGLTLLLLTSVFLLPSWRTYAGAPTKKLPLE